jgi:hypothetical protein
MLIIPSWLFWASQRCCRLADAQESGWWEESSEMTEATLCESQVALQQQYGKSNAARIRPVRLSGAG